MYFYSVEMFGLVAGRLGSLEQAIANENKDSSNFLLFPLLTSAAR